MRTEVLWPKKMWKGEIKKTICIEKPDKRRWTTVGRVFRKWKWNFLSFCYAFLLMLVYVFHIKYRLPTKLLVMKTNRKKTQLLFSKWTRFSWVVQRFGRSKSSAFKYLKKLELNSFVYNLTVKFSLWIFLVTINNQYPHQI